MSTGAIAACILLGIPAVCYAAQAFNYLISQGRVGMALCFAGYVVANIGLVMDYFGK